MMVAVNPWLPVPKESRLLEQVIELAKIGHWAVYHTWRSVRSQAGFPDLVLCRPPRIVFAEIKRDVGGRVSVKQRLWLGLLQQCPGIEAYLWKLPSQWPEVRRVLLGAAA